MRQEQSLKGECEHCDFAFRRKKALGLISSMQPTTYKPSGENQEELDSLDVEKADSGSIERREAETSQTCFSLAWEQEISLESGGESKEGYKSSGKTRKIGGRQPQLHLRLARDGIHLKSRL